ncbi:hypothetical protein LOAG_08418 [Loa loa]|uniref:Uncharacterized protein n=1 Tax=Loa loa TaxID=7209 RepID=A0A1S0TU01_LOALO|nr:hypothetical protein LOAG_08418 [Loa loa]EFO20073.2 hypothetical protein LOAG_08418 [Loa loa]
MIFQTEIYCLINHLLCFVKIQEQPIEIPIMQQLNQKRSLNKARNKLIKSSRFWGKRKDDMFDEGKQTLMSRGINFDEQNRRPDRQKFGLAMSSRFWG